MREGLWRAAAERLPPEIDDIVFGFWENQALAIRGPVCAVVIKGESHYLKCLERCAAGSGDDCDARARHFAFSRKNTGEHLPVGRETRGDRFVTGQLRRRSTFNRYLPDRCVPPGGGGIDYRLAVWRAIRCAVAGVSEGQLL